MNLRSFHFFLGNVLLLMRKCTWMTSQLRKRLLTPSQSSVSGSVGAPCTATLIITRKLAIDEKRCKAKSTGLCCSIMCFCVRARTYDDEGEREKTFNTHVNTARVPSKHLDCVRFFVSVCVGGVGCEE